MSHNSERPYGLQASLALIGRLSNLAIPFIIAFEVWQTSELNKLRDNDTRILEWKEAIPQRMRTETEKVGGDYRFDGTVIGVFVKLSGAVRHAVEDDRGVIHIYSAKNLVKR